MPPSPHNGPLSRFKDKKMGLKIFERCINRTFKKLGDFIGKNPWTAIAAASFVCLALSSGLYKIHIVGDPEYLYTPTNSPAKKVKELIQRRFETNTSKNFDAGRMTRLDAFGRAIITAKDGGSVLRQTIFDEIVKFNKFVKNLTIHYEGKVYQYRDICAKNNKKCFENNILHLKKKIVEFEKGFFKLRYPLMVNEKTLTIYFFPAFLGGVEVDDLGFILSAKAVALIYFLDYDRYQGDKLSQLWEEAFLSSLSQTKFKNIEVARFTSKSIETEINRTVYVLIPWFILTILVMVVFAEVACSMADWVRAKPWLGACGCVSSLMGVGSAFGLCLYMGVDCVALNVAVIFVMVGIGMDDMFVLFGEWRHTDYSLDVPSRLSQTYERAGMSITITSVTNFLSFITGVFTPFPVTRIFCTYASVAVLMCYLTHVTFFGGCMALFGHLEENKRHSFLFIKATPKSLSQSRNIFYKTFLTGGRNPDDPENPLDNQEHLPMVIIRDYLGNFVISKIGKFIILVSFVVYIAGACYGSFFLKSGLKEKDLFQDSSYASDFLVLHYQHFSRYHMRIQVIIDEPLNYADEEVQKNVDNIISKMEQGPYIASRKMTESWLRSFKMFLDNGGLILWYHGLEVKKKKDFMIALNNYFLAIDASKRFEDDIVQNENKTEILASRFVIQSNDIFDIGHGVNTLLHIRKIAETAMYKTHVYNPIFLFMDHLLLTSEVTVQTLIIAIVIMMSVTLIFIPNLGFASLMAFTIFSVELGVLGYMALWNVILDPISMVCLIMCVGFSVDNAAHILCAFIHSKVPDPGERIKEALYHVGLPVLQGFISSIIGILALILAETSVFIRVFKIIFLALALGTLHSIFLLPIFLFTGMHLKFHVTNWWKYKNHEKKKKIDYENLQNLINNSSEKCIIIERCTSL